jgi:hypothetical protein
MYSHVTKGSTVAQVLARRLLRTITGIPGAIIDSVVAIFWIPDYWSYWKDAGIQYADDTRVGIFRGLTGWIGEIAGFVIGIPLGVLVGAILFFPDSLLRTGVYLQKKGYQALDDFAGFVSRTSFYRNYPLFTVPENYLEKSWNMGAASIGCMFAFLPYILAKGIEFFIPLFGTALSNIVTQIGGFVGGLTGSLIAIPLYPAKHFLQKSAELYDHFRNAVGNIVAFIYAKTNQTPARAEDECGVLFEEIHAEEFRYKVEEYKKSSWVTLLFGPLTSENLEEVTPNPLGGYAHYGVFYPPIPNTKESLLPEHHHPYCAQT